jgi:hypothetical protein
MAQNSTSLKKVNMRSSSPSTLPQLFDTLEEDVS